MQVYEYNIGEGIKRARKEHGLTQEQLAKALQISTATLASYENNKTVPGMDLILRISTLFGITTDAAMGKFIEQPERPVDLLLHGIDADDTTGVE